MAIVPSTTEGSLVKFDMVDSAESLVRILGSQRDLFHSQIDQLQNLVVTQCKLMGVNPLSQEMAAGALSVKIGKKPRDTLNPKAMKYMQSIFSIKDTIGKKETREISALCGVTATQVREYLAGQRSRVRKLVKLAQEKATKSVALKASDNGGTVSLDQSLPATKETHIESVDHKPAEECKQVPVNCTDINTMDLNMEKCKQIPVNPMSLNTGQCIQLPGNCMILNTRQFIQLPANSINMYAGVSANIGECAQVPGISGTPNGVQVINQIAVRPTDPKTIKASPTPPVQEEKIPGIESDEKKFLENIFNLMRKEGTFSGQVKLMEWVLQISNSAALNWFVTKDGLAILTKWLREAAFEEQTSVLFVIFKVLCHLPLHKASPVQMSAILQTVNRLRFYRTSGISNRARVLLSRWSKLFVRSQASKKPSVSNLNDAHKELFPKQRISDILTGESGQSKIDFPAEILALDEGIESDRKPESQKQLKLLSASCDESSKKRGLSVSTIKTRERRKVQLVEQPGRKAVGRTVQVARPAPSNHSRPMSADDIQKAKMRAMFMQDKYGKPEASTSEDHPLKTEDHRQSPALKAIHWLAAASKTVPPQPPNLNGGNMKDEPLSKQEESIDSKPESAHGDQLWEKLKRGHRQWRIPPEMKINSEWSVGNGENSKEVQAQAQRIRREKETIYSDRHLIPPNPKDPWDTEMDFDDSLTPQIPTEQPPETDAITESRPSDGIDTAGDVPASTSAASQPDLELLAVLLKNPDLVFALTPGQGKSVSQDTIKLLDMLKMSGVGLDGLLQNGVIDSGSKEKPMEPEPPPPVSLPSPTPPSECTRNDWRSEFTHHTKPPVLQTHLPGSEIAGPHPAMGFRTPTPSPPLMNQGPIRCLPAQSPAPATVLSLPQLTAIVNSVQPRPWFHSSSAPSPVSPSPVSFQTTLIPMYPLREPLLQNTVDFHPHYELHTPVHPTMPDDFRPFDSRAGGGFIRRGLPPNPRFPANQNYEQQQQQPLAAMSRNGFSQVGTWSPEQSPARSPEHRPGWNFPGRNAGRDAGREFTRQWGYDNRDRDRDRFRPGGGRRRRDRDRDRDWDRRR